MSAIAITGAQVLVCAIDYEITVATTGGRRRTGYRLVTTLTDHDARTATGLVGLYHHRWEIETACLEIKSTLLGGRILRARTPGGIAQEVYTLPVAYQLPPLAMADATAARPGVDPNRAGFTVAVNADRDLVIQAAGVIAGTVIDLVDIIGRRVLADLLTDRRVRVRPRVVKRVIFKYNAKGDVDRTGYKATISTDILAGIGP
ncbi:transposase [Nocardiopsis sp. NPDC058631]|uniref:transposase n=1 Tax=Nocardiopsis sp. NPDC058631 TaxID=3346566 RepID=UPI00365F0915